MIDAPALRAALVRLLWDSVADEAGCTCFPDDVCPQCEAWGALYDGARWPGPQIAAKALLREGRTPRPTAVRKPMRITRRKR